MPQLNNKYSLGWSTGKLLAEAQRVDEAIEWNSEQITTSSSEELDRAVETRIAVYAELKRRNILAFVANKTIYIWPDNDWCHKDKLAEYAWKSDDWQALLINQEVPDEDVDGIIEMFNRALELTSFMPADLKVGQDVSHLGFDEVIDELQHLREELAKVIPA